MEYPFEYAGSYEGNRRFCKECDQWKHGKCAILEAVTGVSNVEVSGENNVCKRFSPRIKHENYPPFEFSEYLVWLMNDYYRPYTIDNSDVWGSAKMGEIVADNGDLARRFPDIYSPMYRTVDRPWCKVSAPNVHLTIGVTKLELTYKQFRDLTFIDSGGNIAYVRYWKKKSPRSHKYDYKINGVCNVKDA